MAYIKLFIVIKLIYIKLLQVLAILYNMMIYISGNPKGICWTHQGLWNYFSLILATKFPGHTQLSTQTFFHIGGFWNGIAALLIGHTWCHVSKR